MAIICDCNPLKLVNILHRNCNISIILKQNKQIYFNDSKEEKVEFKLAKAKSQKKSSPTIPTIIYNE